MGRLASGETVTGLSAGHLEDPLTPTLPSSLSVCTTSGGARLPGQSPVSRSSRCVRSRFVRDAGRAGHPAVGGARGVIRVEGVSPAA